jgi:hypothetical protein
MAVDRVPAHYGFVDLSMIENPTPTKIAEVKEKNRVLVAKLKDRFYYRVRKIYLSTYLRLPDCKFGYRILLMSR